MKKHRQIFWRFWRILANDYRNSSSDDIYFQLDNQLWGEIGGDVRELLVNELREDIK